MRRPALCLLRDLSEIPRLLRLESPLLPTRARPPAGAKRATPGRSGADCWCTRHTSFLESSCYVREELMSWRVLFHDVSKHVHQRRKHGISINSWRQAGTHTNEESMDTNQCSLHDVIKARIAKNNARTNANHHLAGMTSKSYQDQWVNVSILDHVCHSRQFLSDLCIGRV